ncbi:MAG: DUF2125 domain-containing protein [Salibaculum sp.]|uniref:DUF2125 domain-containing protein n=1 Tax=Salibaculum sp. TaxID=2855480 RepID=UPI0028700482|nr:DUF2125 domain-containing protein [Salibaculum sp.]MDR9428887.1 DUF2125 domain-containing protein [Salibaculum sp.]MDR9481966.1 DUF2125 domain-containing protein [Salibaculum sp.]
MRWLTIIAAVLAALYGGYWVYTRGAVEDAITRALAEAEATGRVAVGHAGWSIVGFPSRFDTTFDALRIEDPVTGLAWQAPWFQVFALAYRPNEVIAVWPETQTLEVAGRAMDLTTERMRASARVRPNTALSFDRATLEVDRPRLQGLADESDLTMARLLAAMRSVPEVANGYDLFLEAQSVVLPASWQALLDPEGTLPPSIRQLRMDATARFDQPLDRFAGGAGPVGIEALSVREFGAQWGDMALSVIGDVTADAAGRANGSLTLSVTGWRRALAMATRAGLVDEGFDVTLATMGEALDESPQIAETLTVTLTLEAGQARLGPLPMGPAPRLRP